MSTSETELNLDRGQRKTRTGRVVSDAMEKTVVVEVRDSAAHSTYTKIVRRNKRLKAHDESNEAGVGDTVRIAETRPLSKTKRWRVVEILEKAK
ncbi:MAG: small subunit ribosomal protein [Actinomycetota bacterium]|jgi:small subunit ribosomal protein S17|nr:small subunit ribosomal protein [Actinomycetota bacterium]MEA2487689.1 small subunit ribosomal protein [Actinomycetota bacterium]